MLVLPIEPKSHKASHCLHRLRDVSHSTKRSIVSDEQQTRFAEWIGRRDVVVVGAGRRSRPDYSSKSAFETGSSHLTDSPTPHRRSPITQLCSPSRPTWPTPSSQKSTRTRLRSRSAMQSTAPSCLRSKSADWERKAVMHMSRCVCPLTHARRFAVSRMLTLPPTLNQVCPIPKALATRAEEHFKAEGAKVGLAFEEDPSANAQLVKEAAEADGQLGAGYFRVDLPDGKVLVHRMQQGGRFDLGFGR